MDTIEYGRIVGTLDRQIEEEKKKAEERQRREEIEQRIKLRNHWIEGLERRKLEFEKLKAKPVFDLDAKLAELRLEKEAFERELAMKVIEHPVDLTPDEILDISALIDVVENGDVSPMGQEERWTLFEVWALRWRIVASRVGEAVVERSPVMRKAFSVIREAMNKEKEPLWFIDALDKTKTSDWKGRLREAESRYKRLFDERVAELAAEAALAGLLGACKARMEIKDEDTAKTLRHHVRNTAKYHHLREEVAFVVAPFREELGEEFSFLWRNDKPYEPEETQPTKRMTNREIAVRILRKMRSKGLIGGSHGPLEGIATGFPSHDQGRAKEVMEILVKSGILKVKPTSIGRRVAIVPAMVKMVEDFVAGSPFLGAKAADDWISDVQIEI